MYSAMADLAMEYEDADLQKACETLYHNIVDKRMYLTGGIGSSGKLERFTTDYDLPNDRMYCESCASVGLMMFSQRMASLYIPPSAWGICRPNTCWMSRPFSWDCG